MEVLERYAVRTMSFIMGTVFGVLAILIVLAMLVDLSQAATYNTFFNNVEQGPNSKSNPSLNVNGKGFSATKRSENSDSDEEIGEDGSESLTVQSNQPPSRTGGTIAAGSSEEKVQKDSSSGHPLFPMRFTVGVLTRSTNFDWGDPLADWKSSSSSDHRRGGIAGLTLYPLRDFGINGFIGSNPGGKPFYGADLQYIPFRFGIFGLDNLVEAGFLAGASTLGKGTTVYESKYRDRIDPTSRTSSDHTLVPSRTLKGTFHAGLHAGVNFGRRYGIVSTLRTNVTDRSVLRYWLADVGMSVRF